MASVFLSYDREDAAKARPIAAALEKAGHSVWWDRHIKSGAQYSKEIEQALAAADAVVVLWSERSVDSAWVRDEAAAGRDTGRLVPVNIGKAPPPLGFRQYQTTDLSKWKGRASSPAFEELLGAVEALGGAPRAEQIAATPKGAAPQARLALIIGALAAIALIAGLLIWRPWTGRSAAPVVAVAAAAPTSASRTLARDLLAKLGNLHSTQTNALKLVQGGDSNGNTDFVFEVEGSTEGQLARANLVLLAGKDRALLWSKVFERPLAKQGDLNQQLAYTAAKVLECATEARNAEGARLRQETVKLYLNGCSAYSEIAAFDSSSLLPLFQQVVAQAPRFEGGWEKLLNVESAIVANEEDPTVLMSLNVPLERHMAEARKLNPDMPALLLAEATLLPPTAYEQEMRLLERAVHRNPESPEAFIAHGSFLGRVGRHYNAIDQALRAVQLDPLSPLTRDALIGALTYGGQTDAALEELRKAEQLWPGASTLLAARYRLHLRYGDPNEAVRIHKLGHYGGEHREAFVRARLDPTPANIEEAISHPRIWFQQHPEAIVELAQTLAAFGREEELFPILLNWRRADKVHWITDVLFRPAFDKIHRDPRMMAIAERLGLLAFWRRTGRWPDFCMDPDLPYDCREEAAKLAGRPG